jgi:serine/threonine-protein kinase RsbW
VMPRRLSGYPESVNEMQQFHADHDHVELHLDTVADLRNLRRAVRHLAAVHGAEGDTLDDVVLAVQEAAKNALALSNGSGEGVDVSLLCDDDGLRAEVRDPGPGFELAVVEGRRADPWSEQGRGLFLIRRLMDSLTVYCDAGCTVVMTRRF